MSEWKECKLENVAVFQRGHDLPKTEMKDGSIPVAGSNGIIGHHNVATTKGPGITIGRSGNIGTPKFYREDFWAHNTVLYVKDFNGNDEKFVFYFLHTLDFSGFNAGSAVPTLNRNHIHEIPVLVPPLPEQRAIAGVLSSLDDKIDLLHRQNKTLEGMAEVLFSQEFMSPSSEWPTSLLSEHLQVFRGLSYHGSGLCSEGEGIPMHNLNSIYEGGGYKHAGIKYYKGEFKERHLVKPGDVIVANTEQGHNYLLIGYPAIVPKLFGNTGIFSQHIYRLALRASSPVSNVFLYYLLKSRKTWQQVIGASNGSTVNMLAAIGLETVEFNIPPGERIELFTNFAGRTLEKQEQNILTIRTLSRLRDTLLPKLMSEEVRVNN